MTKKEIPEVGDAISMANLVDLLFDFDEEITSIGYHTKFGKLIKTVKLQCVKNGHFKYWHGSQYEKGHVRRWGKIGTKGQSKEFPAASSLDAKFDFEDIVSQKRSKGYEIVNDKQAEKHIKE